MARKLFCLALFCLLPANLRADNWPQWRGPTLNGVAQGSGYPVQWSTTENVAWKFEIPGPGASTPAVWGDRIFLTCGSEGKSVALCLNRRGELLWQTPVGGEVPGGIKMRKGTGSNPSPTTDGKYVYVYFKSGDLACLDLAGKIVWQKNVQELYGEDTLWHDLGTSPVLTKQYVVVAYMHSGPSYLVAMHKATGEVAWKADRDLGAPREAAQSYTTPALVVDPQGREVLVTVGADHVTAHDAADGKELWRVGGLNPRGDQFFRSISSPVVSDNLVIAPYARGSSLTAIRLGGSGDVTDTHVAWSKNDLGSDVPTPAALNGELFLCRDSRNRGLIVRLDAASGEVRATQQLERDRNDFSSSPILADGRIYVTREDGATFVLEQSGEMKVLATNRLNEFTVATPVFTDGQILIRTEENLYCIGNAQRAAARGR